MNPNPVPAVPPSLFAVPALGLERATKRALTALLNSFDAGAGKGLVASFEPLAKDRAGGVYALWKPLGSRVSPVVYLGSEGQFYVAAVDLPHFLASLAVGAVGLASCMKLGYFTVTTPARFAPREGWPELRQECAALVPNTVIAAALAAIEVDPLPDVLASVEAAARTWLWPLTDFVETSTAGVAALHRWFDAYDAPGDDDVATFSTGHVYRVGDRFRHPTFGHAVVVSVEQPGRAIASFGHSTRTFACATSS